MAGIIKTNTVQLGDSATATQNFVLTTNVDGTATLARGNADSTTQNILTIAADGTVKLPNSIVPAFSAYNSANQTISSGVFTKMILNTKEFDTNNNFDNTTNYRFTPTVAGYYQVNHYLDSTASTSTTSTHTYIYKNGVQFKQGVYIAGGALTRISCSSLIYLNGTTDYIEFYAYITATTAVIVGNSQNACSAILISRT